MGITLSSSSHETAAQPPASPTHNDTDDLANTAITNVTPTASIKRSLSKGSKSLQNSWKTPQRLQNHHERQNSIRHRASQPIPNHGELEKRFAKVLVRFSTFFVCFCFVLSFF